jgi:hypothetical protein
MRHTKHKKRKGRRINFSGENTILQGRMKPLEQLSILTILIPAIPTAMPIVIFTIPIMAKKPITTKKSSNKSSHIGTFLTIYRRIFL